MEKKKSIQAFFLFGLLCFSVEAAGKWLTDFSVDGWYLTLKKSSLTPPDWVFGPVWTLLFLMMTVSMWLIWQRLETEGQRPMPYLLFAGQLALNLLWSALFFALQNPFLAMLDIFLLIAVLGAAAACFFRIAPLAGYLLIPYMLWLFYAAYLNIVIWLLNR